MCSQASHTEVEPLPAVSNSRRSADDSQHSQDSIRKSAAMHPCNIVNRSLADEPD